MAPSVKLYYFNGTGRGNQIRMALAAGGIPWEDALPSGFPPSPEDKAKWFELTGGNTTFSVPILTLDEGTENQKVYIQSSAIMRKVARMGNLKMTLKDDPDGDQALYLTDKAIADAEDLRAASYKGWVIFGASQEAADKFAMGVFPKHVKNLERQLVEAGGDFFCGSSTLSLADVALYDAIVWYGKKLISGAEGIEDPCGPAMNAWIERVESSEGIKAYLESDQFKNLAMKPSKSVIGR